jgi:hypothetical protein
MPTDDLMMSRVDEVLRHEPRWEPPGGFAARAAVVPSPAPPAVAPAFVSTLLYGLGVALTALVAGVALMRIDMAFIATATSTLVMNPAAVAWGCLAVMVITAYLFPSVWSPESDSV